MDIIASIADLCKEKEDLEETVDRYEEWFSELIGKTITISHGTRRHRKFITVEIISFDQEGWVGRDETGTEYLVTLADLIQTAMV